MELKGMALPEEASVIVEAYHRTDNYRFDFGTIKEMIQPDTDLSDFGYIENIKFRVLITEQHRNGGLILAMADKLKPIIEGDEDTNKKCILPVIWEDLGCRFWSISIEGDGPNLHVNSEIPNIQNLIRNDPGFFFYVYPAIIKELLIRFVYIDQVNFDDPIEEWQINWIKFLERLIPLTEWPASVLDVDSDKDHLEIERWCDEMANEFANRYYNKWRSLLKAMG